MRLRNNPDLIQLWSWEMAFRSSHSSIYIRRVNTNSVFRSRDRTFNSGQYTLNITVLFVLSLAHGVWFEHEPTAVTATWRKEAGFSGWTSDICIFLNSNRTHCTGDVQRRAENWFWDSERIRTEDVGTYGAASSSIESPSASYGTDLCLGLLWKFKFATKLSNWQPRLPI